MGKIYIIQIDANFYMSTLCIAPENIKSNKKNLN